MLAAVPFPGRTVSFDGNILVELTKRCNYACAHCYTNASPSARTKEPAPADIHALVASARRLGFESVTLSGGEPMLRADIDEVLRGLVSGIEIWLFTSGIKLSVERLARWRARVTGYAVSLDGPPKEHNALRRSARSFDDILSFLKRLAALELGIQLQSMVRRGHLEHMATIVEFAEAVGAGRILFSHVSPQGRGESLSDDHMNMAELDELHFKVGLLQERTRVLLRTNLIPRRTVAVRFPPPVVHVLPTGDVLPWFGVSPSHRIGNLADHGWDLESLADTTTFPCTIDQIFGACRDKASNYPGEAVPVDDLLVQSFKAVCA